MSSFEGPGLGNTVYTWWKETSLRDGFSSTAKQFVRRLWDFARDSMPDRRRQRYGDIDYDFDYHVNTTGAMVGWRDRLLGEFLSAYQPTEPAAFHEMMQSLHIDFAQFTFIDLGSGKGRTLLMASDYPFHRIIGVELLPSLHRIAEENIRLYRSESRRCFSVQSLCENARRFEFPAEPAVLYLFNPLPEAALQEVTRRLADSLRKHPRPLFVIYHNALLEWVLAGEGMLVKTASADQYAVYAASGLSGEALRLGAS